MSAPADIRGFSLAHTACDELAGAPYDPDRVAAGVADDQIEADPALAACRPGTSGAALSGREHYEYGRALAAGNYLASARAQFQQALALGYRTAGVDLARLLARPPAATADVRRAVSLLENAWRHGVTIAAFELGNLHATGQALPDAQALRWYRRGTEVAEPYALAHDAEREEQTAQAASDALERQRHQLAAFKFYAAAADRARRGGWPDGAWRNWRLRRASLARLLAFQGAMPDVAAAEVTALGAKAEQRAAGSAAVP